MAIKIFCWGELNTVEGITIEMNEILQSLLQARKVIEGQGSG
jgi:hypothetical protein